ncbi:hypothetical protein GCM10022221_52970 [Actinocorallia aurea]
MKLRSTRYEKIIKVCGCIGISGLAVKYISSLISKRFVIINIIGDSMSPSFCDGDMVLFRRCGDFGLGDVVIVHHPGNTRDETASNDSLRIKESEPLIVKRVAGIGKRVDGAPATRGHTDEIPPGKVILLGDNADGSIDSRHYGPFRASDIAGVALYKLSIGRSNRTDLPPGPRG